MLHFSAIWTFFNWFHILHVFMLKGHNPAKPADSLMCKSMEESSRWLAELYYDLLCQYWHTWYLKLCHSCRDTQHTNLCMLHIHDISLELDMWSCLLIYQSWFEAVRYKVPEPGVISSYELPPVDSMISPHNINAMLRGGNYKILQPFLRKSIKNIYLSGIIFACPGHSNRQ